MRRITLSVRFILISLLALVSTQLWAEISAKPMYMQIGVGYGMVPENNYSFNYSHFTTQLGMGYQFGNSFFTIAPEIDYYYWGNLKRPYGSAKDVRIMSGDLLLNNTLKLKSWRFMFSAGMSKQYRNNTDATNGHLSEWSDFVPTVGGGIGFAMTHNFAINLTYHYVFGKKDDQNWQPSDAFLLKTYMLSMRYGF